MIFPEFHGIYHPPHLDNQIAEARQLSVLIHDFFGNSHNLPAYYHNQYNVIVGLITTN